MAYIDNLIKNCHKAKVAVPVKEFQMDSVAQLEGVGSAIYIIEQIGGDNERTLKDFSEYKKKKERACPKLNSSSPVMYVGSSTKSIKKRIEQHIGNGHRNTYALHLKHWFNGEYRIIVREYRESPAVLQIIEDELSHKLRPAFGKRGSNNK